MECGSISTNSKLNNDNSEPTHEWRALPPPNEYNLIYESEALDEIAKARFKSHEKEVIAKLTQACSPDPVTPRSLFLFLGEFLFNEMRTWLDKNLTQKHLQTTTRAEFAAFIATLVALDLLQGSTEHNLHRLGSIARDTFGPSCSHFIPNTTRFYELVDSFRESRSIAQSTTANNSESLMEKGLFEPVRGIVASRHGFVVLEDELDGCSSVSDSILKVLYYRRPEERMNVTHSKRIHELLSDLTSQRDVCGLIVTANQRYSKVDVWLSMAAKGLGLIMPVGDNVPDHPVLSQSKWQDKLNKFQALKERLERNNFGTNPNQPCEPAFVMDDAPFLGREIVACECAVLSGKESDSHMVNITAVAFRDCNANVLRFVEFGTGHQERIRNTFCMVPKMFPTSLLKTRKVLFYPGTEEAFSPPSSLKATEAALLQQVIPLTCWHDCADWLVLKQFLVTAPLGQELAIHDSRVKELISFAAYKNNGTGFRVTSPVEAFAIRFGEDGVDSENEEIMSKVDEARALELEVSNLTEDCLTEKKVAKMLCASWVQERGQSTSENEDLFNLLEKQSWCTEIYKVGLLQSRKARSLGVSPYAIAKVSPPSGGSSWLCSCVFKTHLAPSLTRKASQVAQRYNQVSLERTSIPYFACAVTDQVWWDAIPFECRGHVIHHAAVLDISRVLFVLASPGALLYACLVHVADEHKTSYLGAILKWNHLLLWAHNSMQQENRNDLELPSAFEEKDAQVIRSHIPCWRALRKRVEKDGGPVKPLRAIQAFAQTFHNFVKGGLGGNLQPSHSESEALSRRSVERKTIQRVVKQLLSNAFFLYRLHQHGSSSFSNHGKEQVEEEQQESVSEFAWKVFNELLKYAHDLNVMDSNNDTVPHAANQCIVSEGQVRPLNEHEIGKFLKSIRRHGKREGLIRGPGLQKAFSTTSGYRFRLTGGSAFRELRRVVGITHKKCAFCSGHTVFQCAGCGVFLHSPDEGSHKCYTNWHKVQTIHFAPAKSSRQGRGEKPSSSAGQSSTERSSSPQDHASVMTSSIRAVPQAIDISINKRQRSESEHDKPHHPRKK